jgi:tetratricopeptide (TPR) repeat protein
VILCAAWLLLPLSGPGGRLAPQAAPGSAPAPPDVSRVVRLEVDAPSLDPALSGALPVLMEAALESTHAVEVLPPARDGGRAPAGAGWVLRLSVSGKGPWKLTPRASPTGDDPRTARAPRLSGSRVAFSGAADLPRAVDAVAADLHARWRSGGWVPAETVPAPLARALSASARAVDRYVEAMQALRSADGARAERLLEEALKEDPRFGLAASHRAWMERSRGAKMSSCDTAEDAAAGTQRVCKAVALLASGEPARALQAAERLRLEAPHVAWGNVLAGLSLAVEGRSRDALEGWRLVSSQEPDDPRARLWLGMAAMAAGEFGEAAGALAAARAGWPELWRAYTLEAECHARLRDTQAAIAVAAAMKREMESRGAVASTGAEAADLVLGSLQLMEGHFNKALEIFQPGLEALLRAGAPAAATRTLHETIVEMKRDLVTSRDALTRDRQLQDVEAALSRLESSLAASDDRPWSLLRLRGLIEVKRNQTAEAWRTVERIREHAGRPGYTDYEDAYLSGAIMLKEGDYEGALTQFLRAAQVRGRLVDLVSLAQLQTRMKRYDDARANFDLIEQRLARYEPNGDGRGELTVTDPHLALLVPIYHFTRAQQGFLTGNPTESRKHYGRMLRYFQSPEEQFEPMVREARDRGATPE